MLSFAIIIVELMLIYFSVLWLLVLFKNKSSKGKLKVLPFVSFLIPVYNGEKEVRNCINSILNLDYPKNKIEIIVVNDGSADGTADILTEYSKFKNVKVFYKNNGGKASALNYALPKAKGEYIATMDTDSTIEPNSLKSILCYFNDKRVGVATSMIKFKKTNTFIQKLQSMEYYLSIFSKKVYSLIGGLYVAPGPLSIFKADILKKVGGFENGNLTEDVDIALKIQKAGYKIENCLESVAYTGLPSSFKSFYKQRIRWYRGLLYNTFKHKDMLFKQRYGALGCLILPFNIFGVIVLLFMMALLAQSSLIFFNNIQIALSVLPEIEIPFSLTIDTFYMLPSTNQLFFFTLQLIAIIIFIISMKISQTKINIKRIAEYSIYILIYFNLLAVIWAVSIFKELIGAERRW